MANNIAKIRGRHQMSQTELAEKMGMTKQGVSFNETVKASPKTVLRVAEILNENVFDILGSDALVLLPKTEEDKRILIKMIEEL